MMKKFMIISFAFIIASSVTYAVPVDSIIQKANNSALASRTASMSRSDFYQIAEETESKYSDIVDFVNAGIESYNARQAVVNEQYRITQENNRAVKEMCLAQCEGLSDSDSNGFWDRTTSRSRCRDKCRGI